MGIKDKQTYGEYYWAMQVEAAAMADEDIENAFAPYFRGLLADIPGIRELPSGMRNFVEALAEPPSAGFGGFALGVGVEYVDELIHTATGPLMSMLSRSLNRAAREKWLTAQQANILFRRGKITEDLWKQISASEGYEDVIGRFLYESEVPYPAIGDIMLWARYHGDPRNTRATVWDKFDLSADDFEMYEWLTKQRITLLQAHTLYRRGKINRSELVDELVRIGWYDYDVGQVIETGWSVPNAMLLVQGDLQQQASNEKIIADISVGDIHPDYAQTYLNAILTKPASQDLVAYNLRIDPSLAGLEANLRQIGIHPDWTGVYKELAYQIPPVADIITMAVREAFTPEIAARFGQYEDFPDDLRVWGEKKGLSREWTERYWAAHWSLPSPMQGFDMLHRGVITIPELNMLLRALDVMPFWRDKLIQIAYRLLTRVDIRRMYRIGILSEAEVLEAYIERGYSPRDAKRMADFTVKQTLATQSKFTERDIIAAYTKFMITKSEAGSLLRTVGVRSENVSTILSSAEYKRAWGLTEERIDAVRNLYKKEVYDDSKARAELLKLNLPAVRVDTLMEKWYIEVKDKPPRYWTTAQTLSFIKEGLITAVRGRQELQNIGYDEEHINVYLTASK